MNSAVAGLVSLDGMNLAGALRAGIRRLLADQEHLNKINVFPVPDGDTGTNMAMTLSAVLTVLQRHPDPHAGNTLTRVADAAIDSARGNSGAILAQFFLGLGDRLGSLGTLTTRDLAAGVEAGAAYARESLSEPRDGTLLTVLSDFAQELKDQVGRAALRDFVVLLNRGLLRARQSLEQTREQLEPLRRANVVDAGAQGFVDLLHGMTDHFTRPGEDWADLPDTPIEVAHHADEESAGTEDNLTHRYCTECVISGTNIDRRHLREELAAVGSSLVVAGGHRKVKIHVHVNDPEAVFTIASRYGTVGGQKADDMQRQQEAAHHRHRRAVAIVTDSAADIPEEELDRLEIHVVPMRVHFGAQSFLDKVSMSQEEFYHRLATSPVHPKTSQPPPGDFRRMFEFLASHYEAVVAISLTARVSGTYAAAQSAAARTSGHGQVTVIDSGNASLGQGLVVMYAAECANAGMNGEQVAAAVRRVIPLTFTFGLLGRLDYAVRGGRVPRFVKTLADALRITPVLLNRSGGRIGTGTILFGRRNLRQKFARLVRRRIRTGSAYRVAVGHANAEKEGRQLLEEICAGLDNIHLRYLTTTGTALGVHGGPGMLVVGIQEYEPPVGTGPLATAGSGS